MIDKCLEILTAFKAGKKIYRNCLQESASFNGYRIDDLETILYWLKESPDCLYIKEEPKLRPYKNAKEFLQAQREHGMYIISKAKNDRGRLPVMVKAEEIFMFWHPEDSSPTGYTYPDLLNHWLHQDETPCGILE